MSTESRPCAPLPSTLAWTASYRANSCEMAGSTDWHAGVHARRRAGAHGKLAHVPAACGAVDLDVPNRLGSRSGRTPIMNRMLQRAPRLLLLARRPVTAVNVAKPAQVYCRVAERHPVRRGYFDTSPGKGIGSSAGASPGGQLVFVSGWSGKLARSSWRRPSAPVRRYRSGLY